MVTFTFFVIIIGTSIGIMKYPLEYILNKCPYLDHHKIIPSTFLTASDSESDEY